MSDTSSVPADDSFEKFQRAPFFFNLDWLRGISILLVILHHVPDLGGRLLILQRNGRYGVSLFFAISGFLICALLLREERQRGRIDLVRFYIRRSLRLFPLYYAILLLYVVLVFGLHQYSPENQALFRDKLLGHVFYFSNLTAVAGVGPFFFAWSLAVEEQFYLVFSQMLRWLRRGVLLAVIVVSLVAKITLLNLGWVDHRSSVVRIVLSYQEPILLGVLLAFAVQTRAGYRIVKNHIAHPVTLVLLGVALVGLLAAVEMTDRSAMVTQLAYVLMVMVIAGCAVRDNIPVLGSRLLNHIGKISYGIYLLHMLVIIAVKRYVTAEPGLILLLSSVGVTVLASIVYRYFEYPILQYKHRFRTLPSTVVR